jgi:hypothetical protein
VGVAGAKEQRALAVERCRAQELERLERAQAFRAAREPGGSLPGRRAVARRVAREIGGRREERLVVAAKARGAVKRVVTKAKAATRKATAKKVKSTPQLSPDFAKHIVRDVANWENRTLGQMLSQSHLRGAKL